LNAEVGDDAGSAGVYPSLAVTQPSTAALQYLPDRSLFLNTLKKPPEGCEPVDGGFFMLDRYRAWVKRRRTYEILECP
jgi:hypothetical protein